MDSIHSRMNLGQIPSMRVVESSNDQPPSKIKRIALLILLTGTIVPAFCIGACDILRYRCNKYNSPLPVRILKTATILWPFVRGVQVIWNQVFLYSPPCSNKHETTSSNKNETTTSNFRFSSPKNSDVNKNNNVNKNNDVKKMNYCEIDKLISDHEKIQKLTNDDISYLLGDHFIYNDRKCAHIISSMSTKQCNDYIKHLKLYRFKYRLDDSVMAALFNKGEKSEDKKSLYEQLDDYTQTQLIKKVASIEFLSGPQIYDIIMSSNSTKIKNKVIDNLSKTQIDEFNDATLLKCKWGEAYNLLSIHCNETTINKLLKKMDEKQALRFLNFSKLEDKVKFIKKYPLLRKHHVNSWDDETVEFELLYNRDNNGDDILELYNLFSPHQKQVFLEVFLDKSHLAYREKKFIHREIFQDLLTSDEYQENKVSIIYKIIEICSDDSSICLADLFRDTHAFNSLSSIDLDAILESLIESGNDSCRTMSVVLNTLSSEQIKSISPNFITTSIGLRAAFLQNPSKIKHCTSYSVSLLSCSKGIDAATFEYLTDEQVQALRFRTMTFLIKNFDDSLSTCRPDSWWCCLLRKRKIFLVSDEELKYFYNRLNIEQKNFRHLFSSTDKERCDRLFPIEIPEEEPAPVSEPSELDDDNTCPICMDNKLNIRVKPCDHEFCETCINRIVGLGQDCSMCRGPIRDTERFTILHSSPITVSPIAS